MMSTSPRFSEPQLTPSQLADRDLFLAAQVSGKEEDFRAYLRTYPDGEHAGSAREAIDRLITEEKKPSIETRLMAATTALITAPPARNRGKLETLVASEETEAKLELSAAQQKYVQHRLALLGFETGTPDGVAGPNTRRAISAWQATNKFFKSGYLNEPQYKELLRQSSGRFAKWQAETQEKLALSRSLARQHANKKRSPNSPVAKIKSFFNKKFPVKEQPGPVQEAAPTD